jgi:hypothetical protein
VPPGHRPAKLREAVKQRIADVKAHRAAHRKARAHKRNA